MSRLKPRPTNQSSRQHFPSNGRNRQKRTQYVRVETRASESGGACDKNPIVEARSDAAKRETTASARDSRLDNSPGARFADRGVARAGEADLVSAWIQHA